MCDFNFQESIDLRPLHRLGVFRVSMCPIDRLRCFWWDDWFSVYLRVCCEVCLIYKVCFDCQKIAYNSLRHATITTC
jgi:hypothetical protein